MVNIRSSGGKSNSLMSTTGKDVLKVRSPHIKNVDSAEVNVSRETQSVDGSVFEGNSRSEILGNVGKEVDLISRSMWEALLCGTETREYKESGTINASSLHLRKTGCDADAILSLVTTLAKEIPIDVKDLKKRMSESLGAQLSSLSDSASNSMLAKMGKSAGKGLKKVATSVGEVISVINLPSLPDMSRLKDFRDIVKSFSDVDFSFDILDLGVELAVLGHAIEEAIDMGIPGVLKRLLGKVKDKQLADEMVLLNVRAIAMRSDMAMMNVAIDQTGGAMILSKNPDIVNLILSNYNTHLEKDLWDIDQLHNELISTILRLDPNWRITERNEVTVNNNYPFSNLSSEGESVLVHDDDYLVETLVASSTNGESKRELISKYHDGLQLQ